MEDEKDIHQSTSDSEEVASGDGTREQACDLSYPPDEAHCPTEEQGQTPASHTDGGISGYETGQPTESSLSAPGGGTGQTGGTPQPATGAPGQQTLADLFRRKTSVLDGLCLHLDLEYRIIQNWRHLADYLDAPTDVKNRCLCSTRHSPTELLLEVPKVLSVTVVELLQELKTMHRNDVVRKINGKISEADWNKKISDTLLQDYELCDEVAQLLDKDNALKNNWFKLGLKLKVPKDDLKQIERGNNPANELFSYAYHTLEPEKLKAGYFRSLVEEFGDRKDVEEFLDTLGITLQDDRSIKKVFPPQSDNLRKVCALLNINAANTVKDWKHLASAWKIEPDFYKTFVDSGNKPKPTKILLEEWLIQEHENFTVEDFCILLGKMKRNDVREYLEKETRR